MGIFTALATGESDLHEAGYRSWRIQKSLPWVVAYNVILKRETLKGTDWKQAVKMAWRAFWNAGVIIRLNKNGVTVKSTANGREQFCAWPLARWKLTHHEIFLTNADRKRLKNILAEKDWPSIA